MKQVYLDNAATTFPKPEKVYEGVIDAMKNIGANAGRGGYKSSRQATEILDKTREKIAELVNLKNPKKVIYEPSATIATNIILNGLKWDEIKNVYITPFEHNAIMRTLHRLKEKYDFDIHYIEFDNVTFELDEEKLKRAMIQNKPDVVLMSHISNVTGYVLPVELIARVAKNYAAIVILDCAQSLGLIEVDIKKLNVDFIIFAGHKGMYAPFGIGGFIYLNESIKLESYITGGTGSESTNLNMPKELPYKYECGSYNIEAINGMLCGVEYLIENGMEKITGHIQELTEELIRGLNENSDVEMYIPLNRENHIGIVSFNINGYRAEEVANILDEEYGIAVRAGHHCAPKIGEFLQGEATEGVVRISIGYLNSKEDIEKIIEAIEDIY